MNEESLGRNAEAFMFFGCFGEVARPEKKKSDAKPYRIHATSDFQLRKSQVFSLVETSTFDVPRFWIHSIPSSVTRLNPS